jgi:hypothetical protein
MPDWHPHLEALRKAGVVQDIACILLAGLFCLLLKCCGKL